MMKYVAAAILCCVELVAYANAGHVIVAFDRAIPHYQSTYRHVSTLDCIDEFIGSAVHFDKLYLSVVGYAMNGIQPDIENFVVPYSDMNGNPILWRQYTPLRTLFPNWPKGEPKRMHRYIMPGSMQSLAKPYCVMETATQNARAEADATFIIFVTDEKVQGVDDNYTREWEEMSWYNKKAYANMQGDVFNKLQQFNETYRFEFRNRETIHSEYVIASYELLPSAQPSIYSVSDLPSPLPIKRVRGGFAIDCQVESRNPNYEVKDWAVYRCSGYQLGKAQKDRIFIQSDELEDGDTLEIRMVMRMTDDLYGGFLLSKENCAGMSLKQAVKLQDEAKVLGIMPLSDCFWWWYPNDVMVAVIVWDLLLLLSLIALTVFVFYVIFVKINTYHPDNKDIKIVKK